MRENAKNRISRRERLLAEQNRICGYCDREIIGKGSLDHIVPLILGGDNSEENFIVTCEKCNKAKGDYIIFTNLFDRLIYPVLDIPYFFRYNEIISNGYKDNKKKGGRR